MPPKQDSEENYKANLRKAVNIGGRLGMTTEKMATEIKNAADHFWRMHWEDN
jgi:hypothetical protein